MSSPSGESAAELPPPSSWLPEAGEPVEPPVPVRADEPVPPQSDSWFEPVEPESPGVQQTEPGAPTAENEPLPPMPTVSEPLSTTPFVPVPESNITPEPEPAFAPVTEPSTPGATEKVVAIAAEHPEYLVAAALAGGFLLAKVVKKIAA